MTQTYTTTPPSTETHAARITRKASSYRQQILDQLQQAAPLTEQYTTVRKAAEDAYTALHGTPDGFWQSTLLRLMELRQEVLTAAQKLDEVNYRINDIWNDHSVEVLEQVPGVDVIAREAGIDLRGWDPVGFPLLSDLRDLFAEQDKRITEVARLFGAEDLP